MKKNYEYNGFLIFTILLYIVIVIFVILTYFTKTYRSYNLISVIVVTDDYVKTYVDDKIYNKLKSASRFYIDDKLYDYEIIEIEKNVMKRKNINYHEILLKTKFPNKYKDNDSIDISIYSNKKKIYSMFKKCWESD